MKILVEIDLDGIEENDVYKHDSRWLLPDGKIAVSRIYLNQDLETGRFIFKYIGRIEEDEELVKVWI